MEMAALHQDILCEIVGFISGRALLGVQGAEGGGDLEVVVAVDAGDLLDDVRLDGHVLGGPPGGDLHLELLAVKLGAEAQGPQGGQNLVVRDVDAGVPVHIGLGKAQGDLGVLLPVHVGEPGDDLGIRVDVQQQL